MTSSRVDSPHSVAQFPSSSSVLAAATAFDDHNITTTTTKPNILIVSENVPPQVNGIARRVGMYSDGLKDLGCNVDLIHPDSGNTKVVSHVNPWNFTSRMMIINPIILFRLLSTPYDIVHVVMPANLSSMWILAAFKMSRCIKRDTKPALIVSWHCNIIDYIQHFSIGPLRFVMYMFFFLLFGMLPMISDRILTPTKKSEPNLVRLWKRRTNNKERSGVCYTGVNKRDFSPDSIMSKWGQNWLAAKEKFLSKEGKKYLLVCVGRLSPEKGVDELINVLKKLPDCALWLVGDGPFRPELESISNGLPVKFLGYQSGEALHAVYSVADLFVCPSLTETFGQTVNEALASQVRVALPNVPVFVEAYGEIIPKTAFWKPLDQDDMATCITKTLRQHSGPDLNMLKSWDDACVALLEEYRQAFEDREHTFTLLSLIYFPLWCAVTISTVISFFIFSQIRSFCGGSVRIFCKTVAKDVLIKVQSLQSLPSTGSLHRMEGGEKIH